MSQIKLAIDPGHGQDNAKAGVFDPGAEANGYREADIAFAFANTIAYLCKEASIPTYLTRTADSPAPLSRRVKGAADAGCTHWVSLHLNDADSPQARGYEAYIRSDAKSLAWANSMMAGAADIYSDKTGAYNRGVKHEGESQHPRLAVMEFEKYGPTCLIELGFISSPKDLGLLTKRESRIIFADHVIAQLKFGGSP